VSAVTVAKAYRLLKAIFNTAVDDGLICRNPFRIKGAGQEKSAERPLLTVRQVYAVAASADERYRALVLLAAFSSLRWSELAALRRSDIAIQAQAVRVPRQLNERDGGGIPSTGHTRCCRRKLWDMQTACRRWVICARPARVQSHRGGAKGLLSLPGRCAGA
jgi:integrase